MASECFVPGRSFVDFPRMVRLSIRSVDLFTFVARGMLFERCLIERVATL